MGTIDMIVVNLYQFEQAAAKPGARFEDIIENIDIGGPAMIRSAAKNFQDVAVVTSPDDYSAVAEELQARSGSLGPETHWRPAQKAFASTAAYDSAIAATLAGLDHTGAKAGVDANEKFPARLHLQYEKIVDLRYGENPHQSAALYASAGNKVTGVARGK